MSLNVIDEPNISLLGTVTLNLLKNFLGFVLRDKISLRRQKVHTLLLIAREKPFLLSMGTLAVS